MEKIIKIEYCDTTNCKEVWKRLIENYGLEHGIYKYLYCFDLCSDYGIGLADSTIDNIVLLPDGQIRFFYNINTGDYDSIDSFSEAELVRFYIDFVNAYNKEHASSDKFPSLDDVCEWLDSIRLDYYAEHVDELIEACKAHFN